MQSEISRNSEYLVRRNRHFSLFHKRSTRYPIYLLQWENVLLHKSCSRCSPFWLTHFRKRVTHCCCPATSLVTAMQAAVIRRCMSSECTTLCRWPYRNKYKGHRSGNVGGYSVFLFWLIGYMGIVDPTIHTKYCIVVRFQVNGAVGTEMLHS